MFQLEENKPVFTFTMTGDKRDLELLNALVDLPSWYVQESELRDWLQSLSDVLDSVAFQNGFELPCARDLFNPKISISKKEEDK